MPGAPPPPFLTCVVCGTGSTVSAAFLSCFSCEDHFHKDHCAGPSATLVRLGATDKFFCERCDRQRKRVKANCGICGPLLIALRKLKLKIEGDDSTLKKLLRESGQKPSVEDLQGFWEITGEQQSVIPLIKYIQKHFPLQGVCFLEVGEYFGESISARASDIVLREKKEAVVKTLASFVRTKMQLSDEALMPTSAANDQWRSLPLMWLKRDGNCYKLDRKATHAPKCKASGSNREEQRNRNRRMVHSDHALGRASAATVADIVQNHGDLASHADQRNLNATRTRLQRATKKKITLPEFRVDPKGHYKQFVLSAKEETESSDLRDEPRFLLYHDTESPMMIWAADRNMELLNKADAMIWDGTFYITPKNFEQVWVGMIAVDGWYIPVFYVLMQKRSQNEYERALIVIQRHLVRLGLLEVVQGLEFITDFEMPMRAALKKVLSLSDSQLLGCLYHLCKSWIRKVQELGLQTTYWTPKPSRGPKGQWLHRLCGLPWMTVEECKTAWGELKQAKPAGEDIDKLISYIDNTYMAADALFPPKEWCRPPSGDPVAQRTSNPLEGHHRDLNAKVTVKHPGVVDFIKLLKYAQSKSRTKMNSVDYGEAPPASRSNESRRLLHYQNWKRTPGGITTFDYLEKVAELCGVRENIM
ncbi:hypothetical protein FOL47_000974 [Perkinsus chesapeaki]|uniref:Zinc finger PHD-type domain-containing protein n=1 Tax=Perkinsus chesapeaki TaxID=330153 RepID=A0A7J6KTY6_PERCH|nr:hypothetical protein FOL47_000974 [Perkinsus chesapeaki]